MSFCKNVVDMRLKLGWSQVFLAAKAGVSSAAINKIECGLTEPLLSTALGIAKALNAPLQSLIDNIPENNEALFYAKYGAIDSLCAADKDLILRIIKRLNVDLA